MVWLVRLTQIKTSQKVYFLWIMSKIYECKRYSKISCMVCRPIVAETGKLFIYFFFTFDHSIYIYIYWLHTKYLMSGANSINACFWYPRLSFSCTFLSENQSRRNQSYIALNFFNQFQCLFSTTIQVLFWVTTQNFLFLLGTGLLGDKTTWVIVIIFQSIKLRM